MHKDLITEQEGIDLTTPMEWQVEHFGGVVLFLEHHLYNALQTITFATEAIEKGDNSKLMCRIIRTALERIESAKKIALSENKRRDN